MVTVLIIMAIGIAIGFLFRHRSGFVKFNNRLTMWAIYGLIFLLGLSTGANPTIVRNLHTLGAEASAIAAVSVIGSVAAAYLAYRIWFKPKAGRHEG